ncbi:MAG: hypothetical protein ABI476_02705 [Oxalobacteraceae bacterium]
MRIVRKIRRSKGRHSRILTRKTLCKTHARPVQEEQILPKRKTISKIALKKRNTVLRYPVPSAKTRGAPEVFGIPYRRIDHIPVPAARSGIISGLIADKITPWKPNA